MPSLIHPQKRYWTERLTHKIDQNIDALTAAEPGFWERLSAQARQQALRSLGLAELQTELDALAVQPQQLDRRQQQLLRAMLAVLRRLPLEAVADVPKEAALAEIGQAIDKRRATHEQDLLAEDARGRSMMPSRR